MLNQEIKSNQTVIGERVWRGWPINGFTSYKWIIILTVQYIPMKWNEMKWINTVKLIFQGNNGQTHCLALSLFLSLWDHLNDNSIIAIRSISHTLWPMHMYTHTCVWCVIVMCICHNSNCLTVMAKTFSILKVKSWDWRSTRIGFQDNFYLILSNPIQNKSKSNRTEPNRTHNTNTVDSYYSIFLSLFILVVVDVDVVVVCSLST